MSILEHGINRTLKLLLDYIRAVRASSIEHIFIIFLISMRGCRTYYGSI